MKKFVIILTFFILLITGASFFLNSTYFFNKYLAPTIKEYGFSYQKVDGALLSGFDVENLEYKGGLLASKVELKFNPIKLIEKKLSITKLRLINVRKETLDKLVNDYKPSEDNSSSSNIAINFEIKDILLTILPFKVYDIKIGKNILQVAYIEYLNNKFNIGEVNYKANTSLGDIAFNGKYQKRVLYIDNINLKNFNLKKFIPILKSISNENKSSSDSNTTKTVSIFVPKIVKVKRANLNLSPFKLKDISSKDLKIEIKNALFNVEKVKLNRAKIDINYDSNIARVLSKIDFKNKHLNIKSAYANILDIKKIFAIYEKYTNDINNSNSQNSSDSIIDIKKISLNDLKLKVKKFTYNKENFNKLKLNIKDADINLTKEKLTAKKIVLDFNSSIASIKLKSKINKNIVLDSIKINSSNLDKLKQFLDSNKSSDSNSTKIKFIPNIFLVKEASIKAKTLSFKPFIIKEAFIKANGLSGKINSFRLNSGNLKIDMLSNWGKANLTGKVKNNSYYSKGECIVKQTLLDEYSIPLIAKNIKPLKVDGRFGFNDLDINIILQGRDILKGFKDLNILYSKNRLKYNYSSNNLFWSLKGNIKSNLGEAKLENTLEYRDKLKYYGKVIPKDNIKIAKELDKLLKNLLLSYQGDSNGIKVGFSSNKLKGSLISKNYKKAILKVANKDNIYLKDLISLDKSFQKAKISKLDINAPLDFKKIFPIKGNLLLKSNIINLDGKWKYDKTFETNLLSIIPNNSIILKNYKNINKNALNKLKIDLKVLKDKLDVKAKNSTISLKTIYQFNSKKIDAAIKSNSLSLSANGKLENLNINFYTKSLKRALKDINRIVKLNLKTNIDGSLKADSKLINLNKLTVNLSSPKIVYQSGKKPTIIDNISLKANYTKKSLSINSYKFNVNNYNFYSTKNAVILFNQDEIIIKEFWVNNALNIKGKYNLKRSNGKFLVKSSNFSFNNNDIKISLQNSNAILVSGQKITINGNVKILNGVIKKNLSQKSISDNEDIVILQREAAKKDTNFAKNIKLNILLSSKNGLLYAQDGSHFILKPNLKIKKEFNNLLNIQGNIKIKKGGYYLLNGKKLIVEKGLIVFKGKSSNPNLNIVLAYKGKEYTVRVNISGTPSRPVLYFSSNPPLTKEQILAYLLFDDSSAAGTHSEESMVNLIGGALAKTFLGTLGIKVDKISIRENGFSIGKSISDNIIIYYNQDGEKASVKTRIDITKSIRTEIEIKEDSQSADIIFTKEY